MATPQIQQGEPQASSARLCWVLNRDINPYTATFGGQKITVPPNMEKIPLRVEEGGNLMPYLAAVKFVRDLKQPQGFTVNDNGDRDPIFGPKMLLEAEMTEKERLDILNKSPTEIKKEFMSDEKKARKGLSGMLDKITNKVAVEDNDP